MATFAYTVKRWDALLGRMTTVLETDNRGEVLSTVRDIRLLDGQAFVYDAEGRIVHIPRAAR